MPSEYQIIIPILHDGERHESGHIVLSAEQAAPLLAVGAIAPAAEEAGLSEREHALRAALADLDASDPERAEPGNWTKQGAPALPAVRRYPELSDVTREEVDAAWAALHQAHSGD